MKKESKSTRRKTVAGNPPADKKVSNRRRFIKQTFAAGVAGGGALGAGCQSLNEPRSATERVKPHKTPDDKKDHKGKVPKELKESMEWDFERFLHEIIERIRAGETTQGIQRWIQPSGSTIDSRQVIWADLEGDGNPFKRPHALGVCLVAPIEWKLEDDEIVGFVIRGRMGRKISGDLLDCGDYPTMDQIAPGEARNIRAPAKSRRASAAKPGDLKALYFTWGSSSSSSSSSSWPRR